MSFLGMSIKTSEHTLIPFLHNRYLFQKKHSKALIETKNIFVNIRQTFILCYMFKFNTHITCKGIHRLISFFLIRLILCTDCQQESPKGCKAEQQQQEGQSKSAVKTSNMCLEYLILLTSQVKIMLMCKGLLFE